MNASRVAPSEQVDAAVATNYDVSPTAFLHLINEEIGAAQKELLRAAPPLESLAETLGDAPSFLHVWRPLLDERLLMFLARTCVLELHVARLQEKLTGDTPTTRFQCFIGRLGQPEIARQLWQEYPVLRDQIDNCLRQWVEFGAEFARRLADDWSRLKNEFFADSDPGPIVRIDGGVGDRHKDGRCVLIIHFGSGARLVYKPRSMAVESRFAELIEWLNRRGVQPPLRPLRVIDRRDYGWAEFIAAAECTSRAQVERFYRRQGMYLAVLTLLAATDFHFENLVAHGEHPVLIDLEALFHRRLPSPHADPISRGLAHSASAVRLLPQVFYVDGLAEPIDFSGLGAIPGQPTPFAAPTWSGADADALQLEAHTAALTAGKHRPSLNGTLPPLAEYQRQVLQGFESMYALLCRERISLLDPAGPLSAFAGIEVRFIARPTQCYAILLDQSLHPNRLRDPLSRRRLFERLDNRVREYPCLEALLPVEFAALDRHDVPLFTSRPDSLDLWSSDGRRFTGFFAQTGLDIVRERLRNLGQDDLARQTWLIQASFATLPGQDEASFARLQPLPDCSSCELERLVSANVSLLDSSPLSDESVQTAWPLASARTAAERLRRLAWQDDMEADWLALNRRGRGWQIGPIGLGQQGGLAGIVKFLRDVSRRSKDVVYGQLALKAAAALRRRLQETADEDACSAAERKDALDALSEAAIASP